MIASLTLLDVIALPRHTCLDTSFVLMVDNVPLHMGVISVHAGCVLSYRVAPERVFRVVDYKAPKFRCDVCGRHDYVGGA